MLSICLLSLKAVFIKGSMLWYQESVDMGVSEVALVKVTVPFFAVSITVVSVSTVSVTVV